METEKDEAIRNAQNAHLNEIKHQLEIANQNLETAELHKKHLISCKNEAEKQRDYYKKTHDELQRRADDSMNSLQANELRRERDGALEKANLTEQKMVELKKQLERNDE